MIETVREAALRRGLADSGAGEARLYLRPLGLLCGGTAAAALAAGRARPLAGGPAAFLRLEVALRGARRIVVADAAIDEALAWADREGAAVAEAVHRRLDRLTAARQPFAGLALDRPRIMGVVNVTPDSFSDAGEHPDPRSAIRHGERLIADGADILDVGGESTRPGAEPVDPAAEAGRAVPVVAALAGRGPAVSVDSRRASVMAAALDAGATILNDVTALAGDPESLPLAARRGAPVVLMHMQGEPRTMQADPQYDSVLHDVFDYLEARVAACLAAGIPLARIAVDPGIGFGKTVPHNLALLGGLALFHGLGCAVLVGASRKRFISTLDREMPARERVAGSLAAALAAVGRGAQIVRVHDVAETRQALAVAGAIATAG